MPFVPSRERLSIGLPSSIRPLGHDAQSSVVVAQDELVNIVRRLFSRYMNQSMVHLYRLFRIFWRNPNSVGLVFAVLSLPFSPYCGRIRSVIASVIGY
jgi:hypothetical protein